MPTTLCVADECPGTELPRPPSGLEPAITVSRPAKEHHHHYELNNRSRATDPAVGLSNAPTRHKDRETTSLDTARSLMNA